MSAPVGSIAETTLGRQLVERAGRDSDAAAVYRYVRTIRNAEKRSYAISWGAYVLGMAAEPDASIYALSYMGAQAVRLALGSVAR